MTTSIETLHWPARLDGESQEDYKARRARSNAYAKLLSDPEGPKAPARFVLHKTSEKKNKIKLFIRQLREHGAIVSHRQFKKYVMGERINGLGKHMPVHSTFGHHGVKLGPFRKHKQHKHPLQDQFGAYTRTGREPVTGVRRKWVAGLSQWRVQGDA
jgi:hypothetical protein